MIFVARN